MSPANRSKLALLFIAVAAFLIQRSATVPWAVADSADGRRLAVSPIGVTQLSPAPQPAPAGQCRWWPKAGNAELCATPPGGEAALEELGRVYPLMTAALWLAIAALFIQVLQRPRPILFRTGVTGAVAVLVGVAMASFTSGAGSALVVIQGQPLQLGVAGTAMATLALVLAALSAWLHWQGQRASRPT